MKQPKFRGKCKETDTWHYGFGWFLTDYTNEYIEELGQQTQDAILLTEWGIILCHLESMGQYIESSDVHEKEIFAGDILQNKRDEPGLYVVAYKDHGFQREFRFIDRYQNSEWVETTHAPIHPKDMKIVGNIFDQERPLDKSRSVSS